MSGDKNTSDDPIGLSKKDLEALFEGVFNQESEDPPNTPLLEASFEDQDKQDSAPEFSDSQSGKMTPEAADKRPKSSLRFKYEAEVSSVIKTHGDLEAIRRNLGLSKRKISQLLMVHPSAWTRWTKPDNEAPPHIYRALEWFLLLQEKHPQYKASLWLNAVATPQIPPKELESLKTQLLSWVKGEMEEFSKPHREPPPFKAEKGPTDQLHQIKRREFFLKVSVAVLSVLLLVSLLF